MYTKPALPAAILGTIATVGWVFQGFGNGYYFREVTLTFSISIYNSACFQIWLHHKSAGHSVEKVNRSPYHNDLIISNASSFRRPRPSWRRMVQRHTSQEDELPFSLDLVTITTMSSMIRPHVFGLNDYVLFFGPTRQLPARPVLFSHNKWCVSLFRFEHGLCTAALASRSLISHHN